MPRLSRRWKKALRITIGLCVIVGVLLLVDALTHRDTGKELAAQAGGSCNVDDPFNYGDDCEACCDAECSGSILFSFCYYTCKAGQYVAGQACCACCGNPGECSQGETGGNIGGNGGSSAPASSAGSSASPQCTTDEDCGEDSMLLGMCSFNPSQGRCTQIEYTTVYSCNGWACNIGLGQTVQPCPCPPSSSSSVSSSQSSSLPSSSSRSSSSNPVCPSGTFCATFDECTEVQGGFVSPPSYCGPAADGTHCCRAASSPSSAHSSLSSGASSSASVTIIVSCCLDGICSVGSVDECEQAGGRPVAGNPASGLCQQICSAPSSRSSRSSLSSHASQSSQSSGLRCVTVADCPPPQPQCTICMGQQNGSCAQICSNPTVNCRNSICEYSDLPPIERACAAQECVAVSSSSRASSVSSSVSSSRSSSASSRTSLSSHSTSSRTSQSSSVIIGGVCFGNECALGGDTHCNGQGLICTHVSTLPCIKCASAPSRSSRSTSSQSRTSSRFSSRSSSRSSSGFTSSTGCTSNAHCPSGMICQNGTCTTPTSCTGLECQLGGNSFCAAQSKRCALANTPSCYSCISDLPGDIIVAHEEAPTSCSNLECTLGGDSFCRSLGMVCTQSPTIPCVRCIPPSFSLDFPSSASSSIPVLVLNASSQSSAYAAAELEILPGTVIELPFTPSTGDGNQTSGLLPNGSACTSNIQCLSGLCLNGVCTARSVIPPANTATGPTALLIMIGGAAAGYAWVRRKRV